MFWNRPSIKVNGLIQKVYPQGRVNPNLLQFFENRRLNDVTPLVIESFKEHRLKTVSNASVNRELAALKHCFNKAILWRLVRENPVKGVQFLKETPKDRYLTYSEEALFVSEVPDWLKPIILIATNTGLRLGELTSLTWSNVDLNQKVLTVMKSKNGLPRVIPLNGIAYQVLNSVRRQDNQERIFPLSNSWISHSFKRICRKLGLTDITFHSLRHTFGSRLAQHSINVFAIQRLMGHQSVVMSARYSHHDITSLRSSVEQLINVNWPT
jgi:integrase